MTRRVRRLTLADAEELCAISARLEAATPSRIPLLTPVRECEHNDDVTTTETTQTFQAGQIVTATSVCDSDCVWTFEVVRRTAKFITLRDVDSGETVRVGVRAHGGEEWASPFGSFSMAPVVRAGADRRIR